MYTMNLLSFADASRFITGQYISAFTYAITCLCVYYEHIDYHINMNLISFKLISS